MIRFCGDWARDYRAKVKHGIILLVDVDMGGGGMLIQEYFGDSVQLSSN